MRLNRPPHLSLLSALVRDSGEGVSDQRPNNVGFYFAAGAKTVLALNLYYSTGRFLQPK
jgi:hypothetical protein